jgi:8-amino-7-oxononanoate synthase
MDWYEENLQNFKIQGLYRQLAVVEPISATHAYVNGKRCLLLATNNYLGLTHSPRVMNAVRAAVGRYGSGGGGSRLITGNHPLYKELEQELAIFKGTEAALVFSSGYMANVGVISAVAGAEDVIFSDQLNHASIIDGCRLAKGRTIVYRHRDMDHLKQCLAATPCRGRRWIITDGVFSMDGDIAPLEEMVLLAGRYSASVMVDDAHAVGVLADGRGTPAYFGVENQVDIHMGTLSKALAAEGGYVAGSSKLIQYIINKARNLIFNTALAPATVAAAFAALQEMKERPELMEKLRENACLMRNGLRSAGIAAGGEETPIIPVLLGESEKAVCFAKRLQECGVMVSAIRPPTVPDGASRLRITVSAAHERKELEMALCKIKQVFAEIFKTAQ